MYIYICAYVCTYINIKHMHACTYTHSFAYTYSLYKHIHTLLKIVLFLTRCSQTFSTYYKCIPTFPDKCSPGSYSTAGVEPCTPCELGTFADKEGTGQCQPCPPGTSTADEGASQLAQCKGSTSYILLNFCNQFSFCLLNSLYN